jgi:hypothetical protein
VILSSERRGGPPKRRSKFAFVIVSPVQ